MTNADMTARLLFDKNLSFVDSELAVIKPFSFEEFFAKMNKQLHFLE